MANANNPFGFALIKTEGKECRVKKYAKTTGAALFPGDAVKLVSAGTVSVAAAGDAIVGIAAEYVASAGAEIMVYDDPEAEFMVQCEGGAFAAADVGQNINIAANAGDSTLKQSNHTVDIATLATTSTHQFKILGLMDRGENAVGNYAIVRVKPNSHQFKAGVTGV